MMTTDVDVGDAARAERLALELLRNRVAARPARRVVVPPEGTIAALDAALAREPLLCAAVAAGALRRVGAAGSDAADLVVRAPGDPAAPAACREAVVLPGAEPPPSVERQCLRLRVATVATGDVLVVPGTSAPADGRLTAAACERVAVAAARAAREPLRAVVLSGWSWMRDGPSEAEQMLRAWTGGTAVPVLLDEAARTTAENAVCAGRLAAALDGVAEVRLVVSWSNALRAQILAAAAWRRGPRLGPPIVSWGRAHGESLRPGVVGLWWMPRHLRAARALLRFGPDDPRASTVPTTPPPRLACRA